MPPGGFRLAIVNAGTSAVGLAVRDRPSRRRSRRRSLGAPRRGRERRHGVKTDPAVSARASARSSTAGSRCPTAPAGGAHLAPGGRRGEPVPAILEYIPYRKRDFMRARDEPMHR